MSSVTQDNSTELLSALEEALATDKVAPKDREFATSLLANAKKGILKERGWYWVGVMVTRASGGAPARVVGDFSGVYAMFQRASNHLKRPKVTLRTQGGESIVLYLSGEQSRRPNVVNVKQARRQTMDGVEPAWYGRVGQDGAWEVSQRLTPEDTKTLPDIEELLGRLAKDPETVAAEYGKLTGRCCFCYRALADERSTTVGYGKQCAERYQLSWG